jgi:hypothetical protein
MTSNHPSTKLLELEFNTTLNRKMFIWILENAVFVKSFNQSDLKKIEKQVIEAINDKYGMDLEVD